MTPEGVAGPRRIAGTGDQPGTGSLRRFRSSGRQVNAHPDGEHFGLWKECLTLMARHSVRLRAFRYGRSNDMVLCRLNAGNPDVRSPAPSPAIRDSAPRRFSEVTDADMDAFLQQARFAANVTGLHEGTVTQPLLHRLAERARAVGISLREIARVRSSPAASEVHLFQFVRAPACVKVRQERRPRRNDRPRHCDVACANGWRLLGTEIVPLDATHVTVAAFWDLSAAASRGCRDVRVRHASTLINHPACSGPPHALCRTRSTSD